MIEWQPIETAPKDRRILGYGVLGFDSVPSIGTVVWNGTYLGWNLDPSEATEYSPEHCELTYWMPLPEPPTQQETK